MASFYGEIKELEESGLFFTDTHAHVHFKDFEGIEFVGASKKNAVRRIITVGISLQDSINAMEYAKNRNGFYSSAGVHPHDAKDFKNRDIDKFESLLDNDKVVAVGEIGLDFFRNISEKSLQEKVFLTFLDMASYKNKPIIIHNREASEDIIKNVDKIYKNSNPPKGIIHCFNGDKNLLKWALDKGFFISFAGPVTYKKNNELRDTLNYVPLDRILIETDCPYLTPEPFRGKLNDPSYVVYTAYTLSKFLKTKMQKLAEQLEKNLLTLFGKMEVF